MTKLTPFSPSAWQRTMGYRTAHTSVRPVSVLYSKLALGTFSQLRLAVFCFTSFVLSGCHYQVIIIINRHFILYPSAIPFSIDF